MADDAKSIARSKSASLAVDFAHRIGVVDLVLVFDVPRGITVLFGPSGAGKSTTLAVIAGLLAPTRGKIKLGEATWLDTERGISLAVHKRHVAFVFQSPALFPHMTALANVTYGMGASLSADEKRARAHKLLVEWRVPHVADRKPRTFSGGEAQRVALARAFATSPGVVLLDEPFAALDEPLRDALMADVRRSVDDLGVPALFVTHSVREAEALGDRVIVLEKGQIVSQGPVKETLATARKSQG